LDIDSKLKQSVDITSAWEAIPFSWFIDYMVNVGDFLKTSRNEIPVLAENMCIMYQLSSYAVWHNVTCNWELSGTNGQSSRISKDRYVSANPSPSLTANLAVLSPGQWSILGSLAVLSLVGQNPQVQL